MSRRLPGVLLLVCLLVALGMVGQAHASHYRLSASGFLEAHEMKALGKAGIHTTKDLLALAGPQQTRRALARTTGMTRKRLLSLAEQCDLLRIRGVGPVIVRLLQAAGFASTRPLGRANPGKAWKALRAANIGRQIAPTVPPEAIVASWVKTAARLVVILGGRP